MTKISFLFIILLFSVTQAFALARPGVEFKIFQFPPDKIPVIVERMKNCENISKIDKNKSKVQLEVKK